MSHLLHELQGGDDSYDDDDDSYYDDDHDQDTETPVKTLDEYIQGQNSASQGRTQLKISRKARPAVETVDETLAQMMLRGEHFVAYQKSKDSIASFGEDNALALDHNDVFEPRRGRLKERVDFRPTSLAHMMRFELWDVPPKTFVPRFGHSASIVGSPSDPAVLFFGGCSSTDEFVSQNIQVYMAASNTWRNIPVRGQAPRRRVGHTAVLDASGNRLIIIGGLESSGARVNTVDVLHGVRDLEDCYWNELHPGNWRIHDGEDRDIRYGVNDDFKKDWCGCDPSVFDERYGGVDNRKMSNFHEPHWRRYQIDDACLPPAVSYHTCVLRGHNLWVYGGLTGGGQASNELLSLDLHNFGTTRMVTTDRQSFKNKKGARQYYTVEYEGNVVQFQWIRLATRGEAPPRAGHTAALINRGKEMIVVGGSGSTPEEVHLLDTATLVWRTVEVPGLPAMMHHSMTEIGKTGRFLLFGGYGAGWVSMNNLFVLDTVAWTCCEINVQGAIPSPRGQLAAVLVGKRVIITSGFNRSVLQPEMHILTHPFDTSGFISMLGSDLLKVFDDESTADVCFVVEGRPIFCHKIILAARSRRMRDLFSDEDSMKLLRRTRQEDDDQKQVIQIAGDQSYEIFVAMLKYLYCDRVSLSIHDAKALMALADEYGLDQLRAIAMSCSGDDMVIPPSRLNSDLGWALHNPFLADVVISCEGRDIPCHRVVLMQRSDYFQAMLSAGFREQLEGRIILPEEGPIFEHVLRFIYTDTIEANPQMAFDLLCECSIFRISNLMERCEQILLDAVDLDNVIVLFEAADRYSSEVLRDACRSYIFRNFWALDEAGAFDGLSQELIVELRDFRIKHGQALGSLERLADNAALQQDGEFFIDLEGVNCQHCQLPFVFNRQLWAEDPALPLPKDNILVLTKGRAKFLDKIISLQQMGHLAACEVDGQEFFTKRHYGTKRDAQQNAALYAWHKLNCKRR